jgi:hypothetical protein
MSNGNPWLQRQRKTDLYDTAKRLGLEGYVHLAESPSSVRKVMRSLVCSVLSPECHPYVTTVAPDCPHAKTRLPWL